MMQAIALSLGENFPMVVDQVILVVVMMHGMFGTLVVLVIIVVLYNDGVMVQ